jgi:hypothetical protein
MRVVWFLFFTLIVALSWSGTPACARDSYFSTRLGVSLSTLQETLGKVAGPVTFAPRPGSKHGTQEAWLAGNVGIVQAGGDPGNLTTVVLWVAVDEQGKLVGADAQPYLNALAKLFTADSEPILLWVNQVLSRAIAESTDAPHLEASLFAGHQFKATYMPTLSPPMLSLAVTIANE